ncbi:peroxidase 57-like [Neltuma alba]|uniref:peroxidase 57-like n=1 Tax=Neltuma alba TaxID=207710 RepID=UPI0010A3DED4|nr:peroxidase 57-like [Prosopis alba]
MVYPGIADVTELIKVARPARETVPPPLGLMGCDASLLINSTEAEKDAGARVRGFDFIDKVKERLEAACPSTVSCADIITLATRDAVALAGGPKYEVHTGRRDGLVSRSREVALSGPGISVQNLGFLCQEGNRTTRHGEPYGWKHGEKGVW